MSKDKKVFICDDAASLAPDKGYKISMKFGLSAPLPPPSSAIFRNGICHADLWLWDAWTCWTGEELSLFTLALSRHRDDGRPIAPHERNDFRFHIRRFASRNAGVTWRDCGVYLEPSDAADGVMTRNVWSGCVTRIGDELLVGFTGVRQPSGNHPFVQSICAVRAPSDFSPPDYNDIIVISDPVKDYEAIRAKGYYLGPKSELGHSDGEENGPILAWRDPYFVAAEDGAVDAFWAAKVSPAKPAIAHARIKFSEGQVKVDLQAPITLPDDEAFTQAEVPKVYYNANRDLFFMLVSTCNRRHEGQPDSEVSKELRLYTSGALDGAWKPYRSDGAIIPGIDGIFGASLTEIDIEGAFATLIGPYTEMVAPERQLTFAPPMTIDLHATVAAKIEKKRQSKAILP